MRLAVRTVRTDHYPVILGEPVFTALEKEVILTQRRKGKVLLHCDPVVEAHCLPVLLEKVPALQFAELLITPSGEIHKTLNSAASLWQQMHALGAGRDALLINLGGGVITDLGGFVAAGFQRGIAAWHIPTTLIGQIDAAIGGKTAVNLDGIKNQTGFFYNPVGVGVWPGFLETLPKVQLQSGLAEIAKCALIRDDHFWKRIVRKSVDEWLQTPVTQNAWFELIQKTIHIKLELVRQDPFERRKRKLLNFGHTIGHALESWFLNQGDPVMHGVAVAAGIYGETALSGLRTGLTASAEAEIKTWIEEGFQSLSWPENANHALIELMGRDKKNQGGSFRFTLLREPGKGCINQQCTREEVLEVLQQYQNR